MSLAENPGPAPKLYLDDLHVGQRFTSGTHTIDEAQIKAFAGQFDPQPFHQDHAAAEKTLFAGLAASGWHTAAITMRLLVETGLPLEGGIIGAGGEIEWPRPTRPGDTLHVVSEVMEPKRRNRGPIAAWPSYAAKPATSATRSCRFSRRDSSSRAAHDRYYGARA